MRKLLFPYAKTKVQISCLVTAQLISTFVFATYIVQSFYFLKPKFQASSQSSVIVQLSLHKICYKSFDNQLTNKKVPPKSILNRDFLQKKIMKEK